MNKFEALEKKLGIASELIDELNIPEQDIILPELTTLPSTDIIEKEDFKVFELENLKSDFLLLRQNVLKLVNTGQRILDSASLIDIADMNPNMLKSLAEIQNSLGNNLNLLVNMYKSIAEIETSRNKHSKNKQLEPTAINTGSITNNNIVFSGSSSALLDLIKQNQ